YLGRLPLDSLEQLARHLDSCPHCPSSLEALEGKEDAVIAGLRQAVGVEPFSEENECRQALAKVQALVRSPCGPGEAIPEQLGQYRLLERLGQGGMGTVYRALHTRLKRVVALKVLSNPRMSNTQAVARFQREMEAVGKLDHPHIVRASDAGEADGTHFLVMEYVEGMDLGRLVQVAGSLPLAEAGEVIRQAAQGLQHAHEHGLVHRDIKPSNLLLDRQGQVKVADLGLALLQGECSPEELTATGQVMGTVDYMAPEQGDDTHGVDTRADIYSLGCTFYYLLTGRPPFSGPRYVTYRSKLWAHAHEPVPPLPDLPAPLQKVLQRMMAKDPGDRFTNPGQVAEALAPFAAGSHLPDFLAKAEPGSATMVLNSQPLAGTDAQAGSALVDTQPNHEVAPAAKKEKSRFLSTMGPLVAREVSGWQRRSDLLNFVILILLLGGLGASFEIYQRWKHYSFGSHLSGLRVEESRQKDLSGEEAAEAPGEKSPRVYPTALFLFEERGPNAKEYGAKVTDLLYSRLGTRPNIALVEREDLKRVLGEAELNLSGAVKPSQATQVGRLTGAKILVSGSVMSEGKKLYLVAKVIGTETSRVLPVAVEGRAGDELAPLAEKLADKVAVTITQHANQLVASPATQKDQLAELVKKLKQAKHPSVWVKIGDRSVSATTVDPAVQTEFTLLCKEGGFAVIDPD
ncbi:MAG: protein kinase, partial [Planctomycetes bacterium]|nr:protein kinase [Planctomycetota bacterium]